MLENDVKVAKENDMSDSELNKKKRNVTLITFFTLSTCQKEIFCYYIFLKKIHIKTLLKINFF